MRHPVVVLGEFDAGASAVHIVDVDTRHVEVDGRVLIEAHLLDFDELIAQLEQDVVRARIAAS